MPSLNSYRFAAPTGKRSVEDELVWLAENDVEAFLALFKATRDLQKTEATRACLRYLAGHGADALGRRMQVWLAGGSLYLQLLLDSDFLSAAEISSITQIMRDGSAHFVSDLLRQVTKKQGALDVADLDRAYQVCEAALGDAGMLIAWLRGLTTHTDARIRSKAARMLCEIRPNLRMIERQIRSDDARVRANAVESLWSVSDPGTRGLLVESLEDESHRVVLNAIVGLHLLGVKGTFEKLLALADHPSTEMRLAAIWAMGFLADKRAVRTLATLARGGSTEVREKATEVLAGTFGLSLGSEETATEAIAEHEEKPAREEPTPAPEKDPRNVPDERTRRPGQILDL